MKLQNTKKTFVCTSGGQQKNTVCKEVKSSQTKNSEVKKYKKVQKDREGCEFNRPGNVLISDQFNNRVIETNDRGEIVWTFGLGPTDFSSSSPIGVNDAERVGDLTLITATGNPGGVVPTAPTPVLDNRVLLVDRKGTVVWQYGQFGVSGSGPNELNTPVQATFIPQCSNDDHEQFHDHHHHWAGTILITDQGNNRVIQVDRHKNIVWQYPGSNSTPADQLNSPNSAQKLRNGNVLIADEGNNRVLEVTILDTVARVFTASGTLGATAFASRLHHGNTLITDAGNNRIVEVNDDDQIVWQYITNADYKSIVNPSPSRGLRLRDGDTLISDQYNNRVIRINKTRTVEAYYGLPTTGVLAGIVATNSGYDLNTTQLGLYAPYDAKIIGDYTGLTSPYENNHH